MSDGGPPVDRGFMHPARRYDYWLGGKDNFDVDRESGDAIEAAFPGVRQAALANRAVLKRAVRHLAAEQKIRQFLDIGTGLPTADNTHEVAQAVAPEARVVYVDNDPLVLAYARSLLTGSGPGRTAYIDADLREPDAIMGHPAVAGTLDLGEPVALMLVAVLHFLPGEGAAKPIVERLMAPLAPGSFLVLTHATADFMSPEEAAAAPHGNDFWLRGRDELTALLDGLQVLEPGLVPNTEWRPDADTVPLPLNVVNCWAAVARKA